MNELQLNEHRIARLEAAVDRISHGNKTDFGRRLGYKDGAFVRQMTSGVRPVSEKTIRAIEAMPGMKGWFDPDPIKRRSNAEAPSPSPWPFPSISESDVRALPPAQLGKLEGALALAIAQLKIGINIAPQPSAPSTKRGGLVNPDDVQDPFATPNPALSLAPWEGGKTTKQMERDGLVRFSTEASIVENVSAGEPYAANDKFEKVPKLADVRLAAGNGIEVDSEAQTGVIQFRSSFLRSVGADKGNARVVYAKGDSMEPVIRDGAALLVVPDEGITLRTLVPGGVYAINYDGKMIVKVVAKDRLTGRWVARSFNMKYPDVSLEAEVSVRVLGRVVWVGSRLDR